MNINPAKCSYPCTDTNKDFIYPKFKGNKNNISIIMVSEAPPVDHSNYFYENNRGSFFITTQIAFKDAGIHINSYNDLTNSGVYLTTAIKCSKIDYLVSAKTIKECASKYLEQEIFGFPNVKVIMCMGDFAIKSVNYIFKSRFNIKPIRQGPTYKIRKEVHVLNNIRFIPSYTQTGDSFNIEQSKRKMIAEDIKLALRLIPLSPQT
ncbi:MAG TPA: uracil-DNA glycosylase [Spirochaetota bacterium]|nr:uracil-DNA glycosylase [Spirochaetota bacterium]HPI90894.1 uracil-DNA glycosylase [Spirochaetota bacterium]HPR48376.1 uracil-DNA glycosylase [Spirochaetota bacterium]